MSSFSIDLAFSRCPAVGRLDEIYELAYLWSMQWL